MLTAPTVIQRIRAHAHLLSGAIAALIALFCSGILVANHYHDDQYRDQQRAEWISQSLQAPAASQTLSELLNKVEQLKMLVHVQELALYRESDGTLLTPRNLNTVSSPYQAQTPQGSRLVLQQRYTHQAHYRYNADRELLYSDRLLFDSGNAASSHAILLIRLAQNTQLPSHSKEAIVIVLLLLSLCGGGGIYIHWRDRERYLDPLRRLLQSSHPLARQSQAHASHTSYENTLLAALDRQIHHLLSEHQHRLDEQSGRKDDIKQFQAALTAASHLSELAVWRVDLASGQINLLSPPSPLTDLLRLSSTQLAEEFLDRLNEQDSRLADHAFRRALSRQTPFEFTGRVLNHNNEQRTIESVGHFIPPTNGNKPVMIGCSRDITLQLKLAKHTEQTHNGAVQANSYRQAINNSRNVGIVQTNSRGIIVAMNRTGHRLFGEPDRRLIGQPIAPRFHNHRVAQHFRQSQRENAVTSHQCTALLNLGQGEYRSLSFSISQHQQGNDVMTVALFTAPLAGRTDQQLLGQLCFLQIDSQGRLQTLSPELAQWLGYPVSALKHRPLQTLFPAANHEAVRLFVQQINGGQSEYSPFWFTFQHQEQQPLRARLSVKVVTDQANQQHCVLLNLIKQQTWQAPAQSEITAALSH
ncbi:PAS domain-containing protein [Ferrimonas pelagia]|uniref:PAS domain-containing protein n=1 Tax=Ferrimonas pelagia TaxID=1177826 RepID=A0ABP9ENF5_9GAMM